jgi:ssDNA-binding Zn-finger/Zn-ribbon topoisomerase 1
MQSSVTAVAECPKCKQPAVVCRFNYFDRGDLQIHSWEHRCADCGWRETQAFRSDAPLAAGVDPAKCPWCGRAGQG